MIIIRWKQAKITIETKKTAMASYPWLFFLSSN